MPVLEPYVRQCRPQSTRRPGGQRKDQPRELDRLPRPDRLIREDLAQQLEEIYRKQQEQWKCL